ncbi:flavin-containing monooxygenase 5-like [Montipora foliosa]|uniref:flavin-containing monooxygenase 5-like n=1 Tax=Montipora foliosa TaxID=591990 RepID=UPI0035F1023A
MPKTVAIIGAGAAGLAAIKSCLEVGLEPIAFESDPWLGGLWRYDESVGRSCVASSTITNTSKHLSCFSDFPMPKNWPNYLTRQRYLEYFQMYAKHFGLEERIRFESKVTKVQPCSDFSQFGRWQVRYSDKKLKEERVDEFDFVMVCTGVNSDPRIPDIPGLDGFTGNVLHSKEYRTWQKFKDKRVVVLGLGNSAADIACELSHHASQVYLSVRTGSYVIPRLSDGGEPFDVQGLSRFVASLPLPFLAFIMRYMVKAKLDVTNFGLDLEDPPHKRFPLINDELPNRILTGSIQVRADVAKVQGSDCYLKDGSKLENIDAIILATGYNFVFPFLSDKLLCPKEKFIPLYKYVFPPTLKPATFAIIGAVRVNGPVPPICELQCRWAASVFAGKTTVPDIQTMTADVEKRQKLLEANTIPCCRSFHLVNLVSYCDELADLIGARPNLWHMLRTDPKLAFSCFFGPCIPAQFRLTSSSSWKGARDVIMGVQESKLCPLRTRKTGTIDKGTKLGSYLWLPILLIVAIIIYMLMAAT